MILLTNLPLCCCIIDVFFKSKQGVKGLSAHKS